MSKKDLERIEYKGNTWESYLDEDGYSNYDISTKLPSGNTIKLNLFEEYNKGKYYFNVYLTTAHKKRNIDNQTLKTTGKDGLKGLTWARNKLIDFEEFIKWITDGAPESIYVIVYWDDNRRRRAYEYGLSKIGYTIGRYDNKKCLIKKIKG